MHRVVNASSLSFYISRVRLENYFILVFLFTASYLTLFLLLFVFISLFASILTLEVSSFYIFIYINLLILNFKHCDNFGK